MLLSDGPARTSAAVPSAPRQPDTAPFSFTKRNKSLLKAPVPAALLNTWPVGWPEMDTVSPCLTVACVAGFTRYSTVVPASAEEIQNGLVGEKETPQAFFRPGSMICAGCAEASSLTRGTTSKLPAKAGKAASKTLPARRRNCRECMVHLLLRFRCT